MRLAEMQRYAIAYAQKDPRFAKAHVRVDIEAISDDAAVYRFSLRNDGRFAKAKVATTARELLANSMPGARRDFLMQRIEVGVEAAKNLWLHPSPESK